MVCDQPNLEVVVHSDTPVLSVRFAADDGSPSLRPVSNDWLIRSWPLGRCVVGLAPSATTPHPDWRLKGGSDVRRRILYFGIVKGQGRSIHRVEGAASLGCSHPGSPLRPSGNIEWIVLLELPREAFGPLGIGKGILWSIPKLMSFESPILNECDSDCPKNTHVRRYSFRSNPRLPRESRSRLSVYRGKPVLTLDDTHAIGARRCDVQLEFVVPKDGHGVVGNERALGFAPMGFNMRIVDRCTPPWALGCSGCLHWMTCYHEGRRCFSSLLIELERERKLWLPVVSCVDGKTQVPVRIGHHDRLTVL